MSQRNPEPADPAAPMLISGGTGLVGRRLLGGRGRSGPVARLLTRNPHRLQPGSGVEGVAWDGTRFPPAAVAGTSRVVHLAGEPVFGGLPTAARRRRIRDSRIDSTRSLVAVMGDLPPDERPRTLVCASATGYYGDRGEEILDEHAPAGDGFLADLCRDWETEAMRASELGVRVVCVRIGVVLARDGGALSMMLPPFRLGLGGRLGSGRQWFSWIHLDDLVALIDFALDTPTLSGPVNAVAPSAVRNAELTRELARQLGRPAFLPVPGFALRTALGELAGELLGSRRVIPARAEGAGFAFGLPDLRDALARELSTDGATPRNGGAASG